MSVCGQRLFVELSRLAMAQDFPGPSDGVSAIAAKSFGSQVDGQILGLSFSRQESRRCRPVHDARFPDGCPCCSKDDVNKLRKRNQLCLGLAKPMGWFASAWWSLAAGVFT